MIPHKLRHWLTLNNVILLAAILLAVSWVWGTMEALQRNFALQQSVDRMQQEVELMELETEMLDFQKRYYESDEYLELAARERLNKVAPGEKVLILSETTVTDTGASSTAPRETAPPPSNFSQWMSFFFGSGAG